MRKSLVLLFLLGSLMPMRAVGNDGECEALRDSILACITGATLQDGGVSLTRFGGRGDGATDCYRAFQKAMRYAKKQGGARIVLDEGTWLCRGPIHLTDNVTLVIGKGATLRFVADSQAFLPVVETSWEGTRLWNYSPFIYGHGVRDVAIVGEGIIDGDSGDTFSTWHDCQKADQEASRDMNHQGIPVAQRRFGEGHFLRPPLIQLYGCQRVTIQDIFIERAPFWCVHLLESENVIVRELRYDAKLVNNDGIDVEASRNVLIEGVRFNNGDDNVAIKSLRDNDGWLSHRPSENIIVRGCQFKGLHAVVIGSEMSGGVANVIVEDCTSAGYCKRGIYVKTNPDRGGFVRNLLVNRVSFDEVLDLFYVTSMYAGQGLQNNHFSDVCTIRVDSLTARKVAGTAIILQGTEAKPLRDISFRRVFVDNAANGLSIEHTGPILISDSHIGPREGVPSQVSASDNIFGR